MHTHDTTHSSRATLIAKLNEDLAREFQAVIGYVVYSQTMKGARFVKFCESNRNIRSIWLQR